jgi:ubiquitin C-terminal hydrolase
MQFEHRLRGGSSIRKTSKMGADEDRRMRRRRKRHLDQMDEISKELYNSQQPDYKKKEEEEILEQLKRPNSSYDEKRKVNRRSLADVFEMTKKRRSLEDDEDDDEMDRDSTSNEHEENTDLMNDAKDVDALLQATKEVLTRRINFVPAKKEDSYAKLLDKLKPLNGTHMNGKQPGSATLYEMETTKKKKPDVSTSTSPMLEAISDHDVPLQAPSYYLFPRSKIAQMMEWKEIQRVGVGLFNLGNTCFMNAALQCLVYTPPLYNYLTTRKLTNTHGFNPLNEMSKLAKNMFSQKANNCVSPKEMAHNLKNIGHFRLGRQEDSHEFIITLIDKMEDVMLKQYKNKLDKRVAETNPIHQIFGGYLRSQVECIDSKYISNTYDPFVGISLQLDSGSSIEKCFRQYIEPDILEGKNAYKCPLTKKYERAKKRLTIHEAPPVLILHLKRFNIFGKKINKHIIYGETLNLEPYMSTETKTDAIYSLCGVLVHSGSSCHSGHYYSFVKNSNGVWYKMDDSHVSQVSLTQALGQHAYILFYVRQNQPGSPIEEPKIEEPLTPIKTPSKPNEEFEEILRREDKIITSEQKPSKKIVLDKASLEAKLFKEKKPILKEPSTPSTPNQPPPTPQPNNDKTFNDSLTPTMAPQMNGVEKVKMSSYEPNGGSNETVCESPTVPPPTPTTPLVALLRKKRKLNGLTSPLSPKNIWYGRSSMSRPFSSAKILKHLLKQHSQQQQQQQLEEPVQPPPTPIPITKIPTTPAEIFGINADGSPYVDGQKQNMNKKECKSPKSPVKLTFNPKTFARETHESNMGQQVETWDPNTARTQKAVLQRVQMEENLNKRKRDIWDQLMDKGKVKKVRVKESIDGWEEKTRSFQVVHEQKLHQEKAEMLKRAESEYN